MRVSLAWSGAPGSSPGTLHDDLLRGLVRAQASPGRMTQPARRRPLAEGDFADEAGDARSGPRRHRCEEAWM